MVDQDDGSKSTKFASHFPFSPTEATLGSLGFSGAGYSAVDVHHCNSVYNLDQGQASEMQGRH